ncbi:putative manganese-dependent inorganic diphosphatase [Geopsychrobacter electrodiphilus]|uniref:putative manganese-dependent inorganic diphosphatase n=1 Tax=Geopsychrobacter electrodiphilus TaxID=225196 RepID=UPI0003608480|nr:putative manganese-dependent inorganic diphosphatase [Geopsychrobacter electrodiphilus]
MKKTTTYVIGHRNPDTDSICSAIAYAELLARQGQTDVLPARAGNLNKQTEFVLEFLGQKSPRHLADVYPRVGDVISEETVMIGLDEPLPKALELFHRHKIRTLPLVDEEKRPRGLLLLKEITERFLLPTQPGEMRRIKVSSQSVANCLHAQIGTLYEPEALEELDLYVGARDTHSFADWLKEIDPRRSILITGQRPQIITAAIDAGIRMLILSGQSPLNPELIRKAQAARTSLISSPLDTANCCWLTRLATPVSALVGESFLKVGPLELLSDLRFKLLHQDAVAAVVVNEDDQILGIVSKSHLLKNAPVRLILVDHNELSQAVAGADKVEIDEVIDHHRLGNFQTDKPIRFINQPVGSTCTLVATLYRQAGLEPTARIAGLLLAGLLSDTIILKSPTTTDIDREIFLWLEKLSGLDAELFGNKIFSSGSPMATGLGARELITSDFKEYETDGKKIGLGQVEVVTFQVFYDRKDELEAELIRLREEKGYVLAALLVTDIVEGTSLLLTAGPRELPLIIGYPKQDSNLYLARGVLSRKKQLVPHLLKIFKV